MTGTPAATHPLGTSAVLAIAAWSAVVFGLLEGIVLDVVRFAPRLLAPYKASAHQLYVAPLVDSILFAAAALLLLAGLRLTRRWTGAHEARIITGVFVFLGALTVLATPGVIHVASAAVLALGIAVAVLRATAGREAALASWLRGRLWVLPVVLALVAAGVSGWDRWSERARAGRLPTVEGAP